MRKKAHDARFLWSRPTKGHTWSRSGSAYSLKPLSSKSDALRVMPGVFREFAQIDTGKDGQLIGEILQFADKYGDIFALPHEEHGKAETWCNAIQQMRQAVNRWDRIKGLKISDEAQRGARRTLQIEVHRALTDTATPSHTMLGLTPELTITPRPSNLLAYMWLTFARIVAGEIEERPCEMFETCGEYIYVGRGLGLKRDDAAVCGATCRKWKERHKAEKCA